MQDHTLVASSLDACVCIAALEVNPKHLPACEDVDVPWDRAESPTSGDSDERRVCSTHRHTGIASVCSPCQCTMKTDPAFRSRFYRDSFKEQETMSYPPLLVNAFHYTPDDTIN